MASSFILLLTAIPITKPLASMHSYTRLRQVLIAARGIKNIYKDIYIIFHKIKLCVLRSGGLHMTRKNIPSRDIENGVAQHSISL